MADGSKQIAQGQSKAASDTGRQHLTGLHQSFQIYLIHRNKYKEAAKMGRQRNRPQIKEHENPPEELHETEANNLSNIHFRVIIIRILDSIKNDIEAIKKDQSKIKNEISKINNTVEGTNSR